MQTPSCRIAESHCTLSIKKESKARFFFYTHYGLPKNFNYGIPNLSEEIGDLIK